MRIPQPKDYPFSVPEKLPNTPENALIFNLFAKKYKMYTLPGRNCLFSPELAPLLELNFEMQETVRYNLLRLLSIQDIKNDINRGLCGDTNNVFHLYEHFKYFHFECQQISNLTLTQLKIDLQRLDLYYPVSHLLYQH